MNPLACGNRWAAWVWVTLAVISAAVAGQEPQTAAPTDALGPYRADAALRAKVLARCQAARSVDLDRVALMGWDRLIDEPAKRPGKVAGLEAAGPLGFSRADHDAALFVELRQAGLSQAAVAGVLEPVGLAFEQDIQADSRRRLRIAFPAAVLPAGDYTLKLVIQAGSQSESAELPVVVGPCLHHERYPACYWHSGISDEKMAAEQIALARRLGLSVVDTPYLPDVEALRAGLAVSAHYVTEYQGRVKGYAAKAPYLELARRKTMAIGRLASRYTHIRYCLPNSEYGADYILSDPAFGQMMEKETKVAADRLRWAVPAADPKGPAPTQWQAVLDKRVAPLEPGVYRHTLPEIRAAAFARAEGSGWFRLNRHCAEVVRQWAPQVMIWTDPVVTTEQFQGMDGVSFWEYSPDPYYLLFGIQRAEGVRRINQARAVYVTLSQWFLGLKTTRSGPGSDAAMRSPDQHRFFAWTVISQPTHMLSFWALEEMPKHPDCADGLAQTLREVVYPCGTLLSGSQPVAGPVAVYLSTVGDFLCRTDRPYNYWFRHHYLTGVMPALFEKFKGQVTVLDDEDILAGRHKAFRLLVCPIFRATTDRLRAELRQYQKAGGLVVGDGLWRVSGLVPDDVFPGQDPQTRKIPYANEALAQWHKANRDDILQWRPKGLGPAEEAFGLSSPTADVILSLRRSDDVLYAVAVNAKLTRGRWAERFGVTDERYKDVGQAQPAALVVQCPAGAVVYDALRSRRVDSAQIQRVAADRVRLQADLPPAGAAVYVIRSRPITALKLDAGTSGPVQAGRVIFVAIRLEDDQGRPITGQTAVQFTVTDSRGQVQDCSGVRPVRQGRAVVPVGIDLNAAAGPWTIVARDLTSGLESRLAVNIVGR